MKKGRFVDTTTTKLAEWTKKVGTKIKETAEALEVEFNDDGGGGGGQHRQYSHQPRKGNGKGQFTNAANDNRFAALRGASSSVELSILVHRGRRRGTRRFFVGKEGGDFSRERVRNRGYVGGKTKVGKRVQRDDAQREREEFEAKMQEMERKLEEEKTKRKDGVTTPTTPPTKKGTSKKEMDDDDGDDDDDNAAAPLLRLFSRRRQWCSLRRRWKSK